MTRTIKVTSSRSGKLWLIPISDLHAIKQMAKEDIEFSKRKLSFLHEPVTMIDFNSEYNDWDTVHVTESIEDIEYMINTPYNATWSE